jgi:acyl dehydratase
MLPSDVGSIVGMEHASFSVEVEKGRLALFAKAVGLSDALFADASEAKRRGFKAVPAPPTFAYSIAMDAGQSFNLLADLGIPLNRAVHGAQKFVYHKPIFAGDIISGQQRVTNAYWKKNGELLFIETEISLRNQEGEAVCDLHSTIIVRKG